MTRRGWALFVALGLLWGIPYLFIRVAVREIDPVVLAFARTGLGALVLLPFAIRARALRRAWARWRWILLFATVEIVFPWLLLGHAETRLNSSTTGLLIAMVPIVAAIIVYLTGDDRLSRRRVLGLAVGLLGVMVLVGLDVHLDEWVAVLQVLGVVVGYAIGPIIISRRLARVDSLGVITASLLVAALVYLPFAAIRWPAAVSGVTIGSVAVLGVLCTAVAFMVMFALVAEAGPARMTLITYVNPAVAAVLGAVVLGEPITTGILLGFPLIIVGSVLGTWRDAVRAPDVPRSPVTRTP